MVNLMKIIDRIKNSVVDDDFFLGIYKDHIYIVNYQSISDFSDKKVKLKIKDSFMNIFGREFKLVRKTKSEIDINGYFSKLELSDE